MPDPAPDLVAVARADLETIIARAGKRWLSVEEAVPYSSLGPTALRGLLAAGKLTAHRPVRGRVVIDRLELDAYIASSTSTPRTGRGRR